MYATLSDFEYHEPRSLQEVVALLSELGPRAKILAGGCDLLSEIRRRLIRPAAVVSIVHVPELSGMSFGGSKLLVGALVSLRAVEKEPAVREHFPSLLDGIASIASVQVKATGTLVGNLCVATPASDIAPPLMTLKAEAQVVNSHGERTIPVSALFSGAKRSTLGPDELLTHIRVTKPPAHSGSAFAKLTRTAADIAKLNAAAYVELEKGVCSVVRIVLGAVAATPVRAHAAEAELEGMAPDEETIGRAASAAARNIEPITDLRSTAEYRRQATRVLVARVVARACSRALGEMS